MFDQDMLVVKVTFDARAVAGAGCIPSPPPPPDIVVWRRIYVCKLNHSASCVVAPSGETMRDSARHRASPALKAPGDPDALL